MHYALWVCFRCIKAWKETRILTIVGPPSHAHTHMHGYLHTEKKTKRRNIKRSMPQYEIVLHTLSYIKQDIKALIKPEDKE